MKKFLCIHGHFYQPPRENPWLEDIEQQESAHPFHDWNERVCAECYAPNAHARILDERGKILDIVNNYAALSFNFGPTLLRWLERKAPEVYEAILDADRISLKRLGHGNALAQAYNHIILPLTTPRDRETQIVWGIEDFRYRFGRDPEAMWIPEIAVNYATLDALQRHGMKFVILSPTQADRVRPLGASEWFDVSNGTIDPRRAYRCFLPEPDSDAHRFIDVFFYDGMLATSISFGELLIDGEAFAARLHSASGDPNSEARLVHLAADGETFGHHRKHGDMALAYAVRTAQERYGFEVINYGTFLERFPPRWEVAIKRGPHDEGTAWSCSHGVGRWKEQCGCRTADHPEWNQRWRKPLREAIDGLRDRLAAVYERESCRYFKDPVSARNAYIQVLLKPTEQQRAQFFQEQGFPDLSPEDRTAALSLLEMQRHALLMQTSCGWFFNELSGLETTKILQYADRALQLAAALTSEDLETPFVEKLAEAYSNIPAFGTGRDIFYRMVRPCRVTLEKVLNHAISAAAFYKTGICHQTLYGYDIDILEHTANDLDSVAVHAGRARVTAPLTQESHEFLYALAWQQGGECRSVIRRISKGMDAAALLMTFIEKWSTAGDRLFTVMQECFGGATFSLRDMFHEERQRILRHLLSKEIESYGDIFAHIYDETRYAVESAISQGLVAPWEFRKAAENTISKRLLQALERLREGVSDTTERTAIQTLLREAEQYGYQLDLAPFLNRLRDIVHEQFVLLREEFSGIHCDELEDVIAFVRAARVEELSDFLDFINSLPLTIDTTASQNIVYGLLRDRLPELEQQTEAGSSSARALKKILCQLAEKLNFSPHCLSLSAQRKGDAP